MCTNSCLQEAGGAAECDTHLRWGQPVRVSGLGDVLKGLGVLWRNMHHLTSMYTLTQEVWSRAGAAGAGRECLDGAEAGHWCFESPECNIAMKTITSILVLIGYSAFCKSVYFIILFSLFLLYLNFT